MLLIYWHTLRDFPYSDEEAAVGQKLIDLYYNFSQFNSAVYDNVLIEPTTPEAIKYVEISKTAKLTKMDEHFGRALFWDDFDRILSSEESDHDEL